MGKMNLWILFVLSLIGFPSLALATVDPGPSTTASGDVDLNLTFPCATVGGGVYYRIELGRDNNSAAPYGVDWKLRVLDAGQASSTCVTLGSNLGFSIPYIEILGTPLWVALDYYPNPADSAGYYWVFKDADVAYIPGGTPSTAPVLLLENKNAASEVAGLLSTDQGDMVFLKALDPVTQREYIKSIALLRKNEVVSTFSFDAQGGLVSAGNAAMAKKILDAASSRMAVMESSTSSTTDTLAMISEAMSNLLANLGDTNVFAGYKSINTIVSSALDHYRAGETSTIVHYEIDKNLTCASTLSTCAQNIDASFKAAVAGDPPPDVPDSEKFTTDEVIPGTPPPAAAGFNTCGTFLWEYTASCPDSGSYTETCTAAVSESSISVTCDGYTHDSAGSACETVPLGTYDVSSGGVTGTVTYTENSIVEQWSDASSGCQGTWTSTRQ